MFALNSCTNDCKYCYANKNKELARMKYREHDPFSPILCDRVNGYETITSLKKYKSLKIVPQEDEL
jgi:MoaA/NifB/PqqE/SkfB family radical SAM enzyme